MKTILVGSLAILALVLAPFAAPAATITLTPVYAQAYDAAFTPLGKPQSVAPGNYVQMDVMMTLNNASVGEDFWTAIFNVNNTTGGAVAQDLGAGKWMNPGSASANGLYAYKGFPSPAPSPSRIRNTTATVPRSVAFRVIGRTETPTLDPM